MKQLNQRLPLLTAMLVTVQPLLDAVAYWNRVWGVSNLWTMVLRLLLLVGGFVLGFLVTRRRWVYFAFCAVIGLVLGGHVLACLGAAEGYGNWVEDLADQLRTLVLPITALTLCSFLRAEPGVFKALLRSLAVNLGLILVIMVLSLVTGTDPHTYPSKGLGLRGWFIWPSPQSAILSILVPVVIGWALVEWPDRVLPVALVGFVGFGLLWLYGTRLSTATIPGVALGLGLCLLLGEKLRRRQGAALLLCAGVLLMLFPLSPMTRNRVAMAENEEIRARRVAAAMEEAWTREAETASEPQTLDRPDETALRAAYRYNLQGMIDRFGLERVAERYHYTLDATVICDDRIMKTAFCALLMEDAAAESPLSRWFGLELGRTRVQNTQVYDFYADDWVVETENYDPENDFYGVLTLSGIVGVVLLGGFLLWFLLLALRAVWKDRSRFTPLFAAFLGACGIALVYAINTASTLRRNNASVYFAFVLAGLYYLSVAPAPSRGSAAPGSEGGSHG